FADIFEVRGTKRGRRGDYLGGEVAADGVVLGYRGLDGVTRRTRVVCAPAPAEVHRSDFRFALSLAPQAEETIDVTVLCERDGAAPPRLSFDEALAAADGDAARGPSCGVVRGSSGQFNAWTDRSAADLSM